MMLFVAGLNHRFPQGGTDGTNSEGIAELAQTIKSAWPNHGENIVVVASAAMYLCPPGTIDGRFGDCAIALKDMLQSLYPGVVFTVGEVTNDPNAPIKYGVKPIITASRWRQLSNERVDIEATSALRTVLQDQINGSVVPVFGFIAGDTMMDVLRLAADRADLYRQPHWFPPIIAGDFEMRFNDNPEGDLQKLLQSRFSWLNFDVPCSNVNDPQLGPGPARIFTLQNGDLMQAIAGKIHADPGGPDHYRCASGSIERIRLSYSVDSSGRLAVRPHGPDAPQDRYAVNEGIVLNLTSHNVLALGLRFVKRPDVAPSDCRQCDQDGCAPHACHPEDCGAGEKYGNGHFGLGTSCCNPRTRLCCENTTQYCGSAAPGKPLVCIDN